MENMCCPNCKNQFHESNAVPKVLDCSHTFCGNCVQQLCESSRECPKCRKEITKTEYPTSFVFLKLVDYFSSSSSLKYKITKKIKKLNQESKELNKRILSLNDKLNLVDKLEERLEDFDAGDMMKLIIEVKDDLSVESDLEEEVEQRGPVTLEKENFEDDDSFKTKVVRQVRREESVFWFKDVNGETRYGNLTLENKNLECHSLSHLRGDIGQDVTLVRDLVPSHSDGIESFLVLTADPAGPQIQITVRLQPLHPFTPQFAWLCTGERGPSYKGATAEDRRGKDYGSYSGLFSVENYIDNECEKKGAIETISGGCVARDCEPGEVVLYGGNDGAFRLWKITSRCSPSSILGVVTSPSDLESFDRGGRPVMVTDCGIFVPI